MISNLNLVENCRKYILSDPRNTGHDELVKLAITSAYRDLQNLRQQPWVWNTEIYDEIFTRYYAEISAITSANPGVITCESVDPDLSDEHGFESNDIVYIEGVNGDNSRHRLNQRLYRVLDVSDDTLSLKYLHGNDDVATDGYEDYDSGGTIYHAGIVLPYSSIEPAASTGIDASYVWKIKRVYDVEFDMDPATPVSEEASKKMTQPGGQPRRWRYQQYAYASFESPEHLLFWYNFPPQRYNVRVHVEKEYPNPSDWSDKAYLPCPDEVQEFVWHRALANLSMDSEKHRRKAQNQADNTKVEIINAQYWMSKMIEDEGKIFDLHRKLSGGTAYASQGMSA
uniref:Uncharacterized protein n=1 Tax=viral metagenome TaxID=1070528 RepID=A0A6M3J3E3_9ZZZZ